MTKEDALSLFDGDVAALCSALQVAPPTFYAWRVIPFERQCVLEVVTAGDLKADYRPEISLPLKKYLLRELASESIPPKLRELLAGGAR